MTGREQMKLAILANSRGLSLVGDDLGQVGVISTKLVTGREEIPTQHFTSCCPEIHLPVRREISFFEEEQSPSAYAYPMERVLKPGLWRSHLDESLFVWAVFDDENEVWFVWHRKP